MKPVDVDLQMRIHVSIAYEELARFDIDGRLLLPQVDSLRRLLRCAFEAGVEVPQDVLSRDEADEIAKQGIDDALRRWAREEREG